MPIVAAIEDSQGLCNVEVEESQRGERPLLVVETIDQSGREQYEGPRQPN